VNETIPDNAGYVTGWRVWCLKQPYFLSSVGAEFVWMPGRKSVAVCCRDLGGVDHRVPKKECECGIYAAKDIEFLVRNYQYTSHIFAVGRVALWGKVIEHSRGYRAEYAYPLDVTIVQEFSRSLEDRYMKSLHEMYQVDVRYSPEMWKVRVPRPLPPAPRWAPSRPFTPKMTRVQKAVLWKEFLKDKKSGGTTP